MMYRNQHQDVDKLTKQIENLKGMAYRTMVIFGPPRCGKSTIAKELAQRCALQYVDFLEEVLVSLETKIETFDRHKLLDYMREEIMAHGAGAIFDELDGLLVTWDKSDLVSFFGSLCRFKVAFPLIVVTRQDLDFARLLNDPSRVYKVQ